jgi:hypothetical protein
MKSLFTLALIALSPLAHASENVLATCHDSFDSAASDIRVTYENTQLTPNNGFGQPEFGFRVTAKISISGERDETMPPETFTKDVQILDVKQLWMNQPLTLIFGESAQGVYTNAAWLQFNNRSEAYLLIHNAVHVLKCQVMDPHA